MDEATAFLSTLEHTAPDAPTACAGWTAHDLVAHLAAGASEMAGLVEDVLAGAPERPTRSFADREAPFVALPDDDLRASLVIEAIRLTTAVEKLRAGGSERVVAFSGRSLTATELDLHGRSEAALHRWDLAGDDDISAELLSAPDLTVHAVSVLNSMLDGSREAVGARVVGGRPGRASFAAPGSDDVVLVADEKGARLELAEPSPRPTVRTDPATRLLALWGRRSATGTLAWGGDNPMAKWFAHFLWGA